MTDMLEKAARAVHEKMWTVPFEGVASESQREVSTIIARAVLTAIREPDDETSDAGAAESGMYHAKVPRTFTAMIDHILGEGGK